MSTFQYCARAVTNDKSLGDSEVLIESVPTFNDLYAAKDRDRGLLIVRRRVRVPDFPFFWYVI